jgi:3-oxoadipate enol-lactonase
LSDSPDIPYGATSAPRHSITRNAPRLALTHAGAGELLVFLHGIGGHRSHWDEQLAHFADRFLVCAPDLRGFGDSEDCAGELDFAADFCADVDAVLEHFGAPRAHLVGLSMGGRIARNYGLRRPERVASLVLANTQPGFDGLSERQLQAFVDGRRAPFAGGREPPQVAEELARGLLSPHAVPPAWPRLVAAMAALHRESYLKTVEASVRQDRGARLEDLRGPVLVLAGAEDTLYPPAISQAMAARIPGAQYLAIPRAGHLSNLEQPQAFNAALDAFYAGIAA